MIPSITARRQRCTDSCCKKKGAARTTALKSEIEANFASSIEVQTVEEQRITEYLKDQQKNLMETFIQTMNSFEEAKSTGNQELGRAVLREQEDARAKLSFLDTVSKEFDQMFAANGAEIKKQGEIFECLMNELADAVRMKDRDLEEKSRIIGQQNVAIEIYKQQLQQMGMGMGMQYGMPAGISQPAALNQHPAFPFYQYPAGLNQQPSGNGQNDGFAQNLCQANNGIMQDISGGMGQQPYVDFPLDPELPA